MTGHERVTCQRAVIVAVAVLAATDQVIDADGIRRALWRLELTRSASPVDVAGWLSDLVAVGALARRSDIDGAPLALTTAGLLLARSILDGAA